MTEYEYERDSVTMEVLRIVKNNSNMNSLSLLQKLKKELPSVELDELISCLEQIIKDH